MFRRFTFFTLLFPFLVLSAHAQLSLPRIFSDNMVLQRDVPLRVWGWGAKGESITVTVNNVSSKARADNNGRWLVTLKALAHGGPYEMVVRGKSTSIKLRNILVGDVWVGSGQSNMEWTVNNSNDAAKEIAAANYPRIRLFTVKKSMSYTPEKDLAGGTWLECTPETIGDFSAVAYFFGRKLSKELDVPIGLVNSSWGGTNIQTWISWDVMGQKEAYRNTDLAALQKRGDELMAKTEKFEAALRDNIALQDKWLQSQTGDWKKIQMPEMWEGTEIGNADGVVWFRKEFELAQDPAAQATLSLGPIDDQDMTYVNGELVGSTNAYNQDRVYNLKPGVLRKGKNTVVVRVLDTGGGGGIYGKPQDLFIQSGQSKISLAGEWEYRIAVVNTDFGIENNGPNAFPSLLYNAMIAPMVDFPVKGVIWYQGESNTWEAYRYRTLFRELIGDWRSKWRNPDLPFYWAQLANFMAADSLPAESQWAELREAQTMTLSLPHTGEAILIDIGEADDIHPRNKQDVGYRLALAALKNTYAKDIVHAGPAFRTMEKKGNELVLTFENIGSGLVVKDKYGYVKGFAVAGEDKKFYWAKAWIQRDKVVVSSEAVKNPVAVRYAWGNNPDANLYNREGLPATPFRSDTWPGVSEGPK